MRLAACAAFAAALALSPGGAARTTATPPGDVAFVRRGDYAPDWQSEIYVIDPRTRVSRRLTRNEYREIDPDWSPDGRRLAYILDGERRNGLHVARRDGSGTRLVVPRAMERPEWSPDGTRVAFAMDIPTRPVGAYGTAVYIWSPGRPPRRITGRQTTNPTWSPDGRRVAYEDFVRARAIWIVGADGRGRRRLVAGEEPAWSPDGQWIAYAQNGQIRLVRPDGSRRRRLGVLGQSPSWSPDGRWIVYVKRRSIWIVRADGTGRRRLTAHLAARDTVPTWRL